MNHNFPFDPTYGYNLEELLQVKIPNTPDDFVKFWEDTFCITKRQPLNISRRAVDIGNEQIAVEQIEFDSLEGIIIGGWITYPKYEKPQCAMVVGHGYGGRLAPELDLPAPPAVAIFPCARGFNRSERKGISNKSKEHVLQGIESRQCYIHRGCTSDIWCAASALLEIYPDLKDNLNYYGGSFGGGIGALALAWDKRFKRAYLNVPSFGNHPLRVTLECSGSGEAIRQMYKQNPDILKTLAYFDASLAASFIDIPVLCKCALFDPAVPPPGQFSVYNALSGAKKLIVSKAGHFQWDGQKQEEIQTRKEIEKWFNQYK